MPATRDQIALTFLGLVMRHGARRTAVEDVAAALRISKKTIYEHFPSKGAMLEYALDLAALEQRRRIESLLRETTALGRVLQVTSIALADARTAFEQSPGLEIPGPPELRARVNDRVYGPMVRSLLEQGVVAGEFAVADVALTSRFVQAVSMEAIRQIHDDPSSHPEEATIEAVRRLIAAEGGAVANGTAAAPAAAAILPVVKESKKKKKTRKR
jgi:AcrR family transcriptional regulator